MSALRWGLLAIFLMSGACVEEEVLEGAVLDCETVEPFVACGGDIVGLWQATSTCVTKGRTIEDGGDCGTPTLSFEVGLAGSIMFSKRGELETSLSIRERLRATMPKTCLSELTVLNTDAAPETCADIIPREPLTTCADRGDQCLCSGTQVGSELESGRYRRPEPGVLNVIRPDGRIDRFEYCVQGRILDMRIEDVTPLGTPFALRSRWLK